MNAWFIGSRTHGSSAYEPMVRESFVFRSYLIFKKTVILPTKNLEHIQKIITFAAESKWSNYGS